MHWLHSVDQLIFHVGSTSHTTDEYFRVLHELLEDRQFSVVSAFAEAKRCEGTNVLNEIIAKDNKESKNNRLKAEATLLQNKSRTIIATPALDAARLEIWAIHELIKLVEPSRCFRNDPLPLANQKIQYYENILDLAWKAFVEFKSYGSTSAESNAQLMARGLEFHFGEASDRTSLYNLVIKTMQWPEINVMTPASLNDLRKTVNPMLENSSAMLKCIATHQSDYMEAMQYGISIAGSSSTGHKISQQ